MDSRDTFDLGRFVSAQDGVYDSALAEIRGGRKRTHWMWFVFPQIAGLGSSAVSARFAIRGAAEARAYLAHPILGPRLLECCEALLELSSTSATEIFGSPDDMKLRSCATLFASVSESGSVFERVLVAILRRRAGRANRGAAASGVTRGSVRRLTQYWAVNLKPLRAEEPLAMRFVECCIVTVLVTTLAASPGAAQNAAPAPAGVTRQVSPPLLSRPMRDSSHTSLRTHMVRGGEIGGIAGLALGGLALRQSPNRASASPLRPRCLAWRDARRISRPARPTKSCLGVAFWAPSLGPCSATRTT